MRQTDYVILGLLSESPLSGYQIKKLVDIRFRFFWSESFGQIFPALKALSTNGLVEEIETENKRVRSQKTYQITQSGLEVLRQWLQMPVERESYRLEILLKMYFSNHVDEQVMLEHILTFQKAHAQELQILNMFQSELEGILEEGENHPQVLRVIDFGQRVNMAYLEWSQEAIAFLERRVKDETKNT